MRELKVKTDALRDQMGAVDKRLSEQMTMLERHIGEKFEASQCRADAQFHALLAAISQSKAENELMVFKPLSALTQRVATLEARLDNKAA